MNPLSLCAEAAQAERDADGMGQPNGENSAHDDWREPRGTGGGDRPRAPRNDMRGDSGMKPGLSPLVLDVGLRFGHANELR